MYQHYYEEVARFAAEGELTAELQLAKKEYIKRTGDLFETDASFERRIAIFLEWYILDRKISFRPELTPAELFIMQYGKSMDENNCNSYASLTRTELSIFEIISFKHEKIKVKNLLTGKKLLIFERRKPAGLEIGDILEARIIPFDDLFLFSDCYFCEPREARKEILAAAKKFRKTKSTENDKIAFVHQVEFLANRSERYKHINVRKIFAELVSYKAA